MATTTTLHPTPSKHHRFHLLDGLRGVASMMVVYWHAPYPFKLTYARSSFLAVDFFFCLSGFVIAFSYEKRLQTTLGLGQFAMARTIRLYPIYLLGIAIGAAIALSTLSHATAHSFLSLFAVPFSFQIVLLPALTSFGSWLFPFDFPAWSIFFEMIGNLAYGAAVRYRVSSTRNLLGFAAVCLVTISLWITRGHATLDAGAKFDHNTALGLLRIGLSFGTGVLVQRWFRKSQPSYFSPFHSVIGGCGIALCLVLLLLAPNQIMGRPKFSLLTIAVLFPALIYLGARCRVPPLWAAGCALLGDISYPLYLLHAQLLRLLTIPSVVHLLLQSRPIYRNSAVPAIILLTAAVSYLAQRFYDVPVRSWLTRTYNASLKPKTVVVT